MTIPQIQPWIDHEEVEAVREAVESTFITEHERTRRFEAMIRDRTGARHAIAYCNASCALFAVLRAADVGPGDEVIVPDMTFAATANAVILAGATPVFADVDPESLMMTPATVAPRLTPRTRAILPVHLYGMAAVVDALAAFAAHYGLVMFEDAAQGMGVRFRGRHVGTTGAAGVISFYGNKTLTTGEGGVVLTDDDAIADAVYRLKNHGRAEKGVFVHEQIGFNFSFTEMQAAMGIAQLGKLDRVMAEKKRIRERYAWGLRNTVGVNLQLPPEHVSPVYWFTNVFCDDAGGLAAHLAGRGIQSRRFFHPLHRQPCYRHPGSPGFPVSAGAYVRGLSLPSACGLPDETIDGICGVIAEWADSRLDDASGPAAKPAVSRPMSAVVFDA